jgi:myo-inositol-1(or 4)-monophosphatase
LFHRELPPCGFWGEEGGRRGEHDWCWVVDPLDGTTNFVHGIPHVAVSVALTWRGEVRLGVVWDVFRRELFTAREGAFLNGQPVRVSQTRELGRALLATGFGPESAPAEYERFARLEARSHGVRRLGCASLDLCWVACGRLDGFWEWDLKPWDVAAAGFIVRRAGGAFTALDGSPAGLESRDFLASNGALHQALLG